MFGFGGIPSNVNSVKRTGQTNNGDHSSRGRHSHRRKSLTIKIKPQEQHISLFMRDEKQGLLFEEEEDEEYELDRDLACDCFALNEDFE